METVTREIDLQDGSGKQSFSGQGETREAAFEDLANKLADAQLNASRKIVQQDTEVKTLRRRLLNQPEAGEGDPQGPQLEFKPRDLTADEEFQLSRELQNPATARAARRRMLEIELGAPLETIRQTLRQADLTPRQMQARDAAEGFMLAHPEYLPTEKNSGELFRYMTEKKMALTGTNFEIAYGALCAAGLLTLRAPQGAGGAPAAPNGNGAGGADSPNGERRASTPRFASTSTSTATRSSGSPRGAATGSKMPTAEEIDKMSAAKHKEWLRVPGFMEHEDRLLAARTRRPS